MSDISTEFTCKCGKQTGGVMGTKYETETITFCISPCRYSPGTMIGSADCLKCSHFEGIDEEKKEIECEMPAPRQD